MPLAFLLAVVVSAAAFGVSTHPARPALVQVIPKASAAGTNVFDFVVIILMENHNLCDILKSCGGTATYMSNLAGAWGLAQDDHYCNTNPSLPNYLCLTGGSDFGCSGYDGDPQSNACTNAAWNAPNIVDRLVTAGYTWKAYMEDMPSNCYGTDSGNYAVRHNPFVYYGDIVNNATRCNRVVPAGSSDSALINDLGSTSTASNYMWLTPNTCNDIHSCPIDTGDAYLADLVQRVLSSPIFTTYRAALYITFDEGGRNGQGQPVYTAWAGRVVKPTYASSVAYSHFSLLRHRVTRSRRPSPSTRRPTIAVCRRRSASREPRSTTSRSRRSSCGSTAAHGRRQPGRPRGPDPSPFRSGITRSTRA